MGERLDGYRILILETREEAQFARLLAEHGADVVQCPMLAIRDAPDAAPVRDWTARFIDAPCGELILTTGEGLRRLLKRAEADGVREAFVAALGRCRTLCRGPKPGRALREIGLMPTLTTETPTTEGIIATIGGLDLAGHRVGVQLYPDKDHSALLGAIAARGAQADPVTPYVYDAKAADNKIIAAIDAMAAGALDALALTSSGQVRRLIEVARARGLEPTLRAALARTEIASVGPVVSDELEAAGLRATIAPAGEAFFIKPLIAAMARALARKPPRSSRAIA